MTHAELQQWLNSHGQQLVVDGNPGQLTRAAIIAVFTNKNATPVSAMDIANLATHLGCQPKQIRAVTQVESGGSSYDKQGRPKILFERHLFHRLTAGAYPLSAWNNPKGGGYNEDSWDKLTRAACQDALAAFGSASWGRFQILGLHWKVLNYPNPLELAYSTVNSEAGHFELFARFIMANNLQKALAKISTNPADNIALASAYNGPNFRAFKYHEKLAEAMR